MSNLMGESKSSPPTDIHAASSTGSSDLEAQVRSSAPLDKGANLSRTSQENENNEKPYCFLPKLLLVRPILDPKQFSRRTKWHFTVIVSICAAAAPLGSTILMPAIKNISDDLHTSRFKTNLSIAFYSLSVAFVPLWWSALSESYGRRPVYLSSFLLLTVFNIVSAESTSINMFIVMRMLAGGASASVQSVGAGTIADLWDVKERGRAMGIFFLGPMCGPLIGPLIGGAVASPFGWRSTQWALAIYSGLLWIAMIVALPETSVKRASNLEAEAAAPISISSKMLKASAGIWSGFIAPVKYVRLFRFMPITLVVYYASVTFASYYFLNISIQAVFSEPPYSFSTIEVGLLYIPSALGSILAGVLGGRWIDHIMHRKASAANRYDEKRQLQFIPSDRISESAWIAGLMFPLALLAYGWVAQYKVFWFVSCIPTFFFGVGQTLVFNVTTTVLTEFVPKRASTGVALNNMLRNTFACIAAVVAQPLMDAIGNGWLFTIVAIITLLSILVLPVLQRNGERWGQEMATKMAELDKIVKK